MGKGFAIIDRTEHDLGTKVPDVFCYSDLKNDDLFSLGRIFDADLVLFGRVVPRIVENRDLGIFIASSKVNLKVVNVHNGKEIAQSNISITHEGRDIRNSTTQSQIRAGDEVSEVLLNQIGTSWVEGTFDAFTVRVLVRGLSNYKVFQQVKNIIDQFRRLGGYGVYFCSGEFLLRDDALDLVKYARAKNMVVSVTTNGLLLDEKKIWFFKKV